MSRQTRKQRQNPANPMQIICLSIRCLIIAEGGDKVRAGRPSNRLVLGARLTLRKDVTVAGKFDVFANPRFWPASDPASTCFFLLREINYYSIVASKNIFKKHATGDTPPLHAMPTEIFHRIPIGVHVSFLFRPEYTKMKLAIALLLATSAAAFTPPAQTSRSTTTQLHETKVRIAFSHPSWLERFFRKRGAGGAALRRSL